jgi:hypothetical protein
MADSGVLDLEAIGGGGGVGTLTLAGLSGGVGSYTPATDPGGPLPGPVDPVLVSNSSPLTLIGSNGDIIRLQLTATDYAALDGASGFGIPPKALTVAEGAGDGGVVRYTRATVRDPRPGPETVPPPRRHHLGAVEISNPGDVPADLTWEITGPGGPFTATAETGESFTINEIGDGETITVDTRTGAVTDQVGANRYATLGPAPKLFRLPEGTTTVEILLQDATISSRVVGRYRARREVVY